MNDVSEPMSLAQQLLLSGKIVMVSITVCCLLYTGVILGLAQVLKPFSANGSILRDQKGQVIGSELIGQAFTRPEYLWPRPSAVAYDASASGGSNLSPTNPELRSRALAILQKQADPDGAPLPVDLVTASGSGLDPHITLKAALTQVNRIARARRLTVESVQKLLEQQAIRPGGFLATEPLVNVLQVNQTLDRLGW